MKFIPMTAPSHAVTESAALSLSIGQLVTIVVILLILGAALGILGERRSVFEKEIKEFLKKQKADGAGEAGSEPEYVKPATFSPVAPVVPPAVVPVVAPGVGPSGTSKVSPPALKLVPTNPVAVVDALHPEPISVAPAVEQTPAPAEDLDEQEILATIVPPESVAAKIELTQAELDYQERMIREDVYAEEDAARGPDSVMA